MGDQDMMNGERYKPVYEDGKIIKVTGNYGDDMVCVEQMIDELNDLNHTCNILRKNGKKLKKLLYEKIKPTYSDDVYLDIDEETGRCKYEYTNVCHDFKCDYYSTYFLDCRLMMGDMQLKKAKELRLVK